MDIPSEKERISALSEQINKKDKTTRRIIAPYLKVVRKLEVKGKEKKSVYERRFIELYKSKPEIILTALQQPIEDFDRQKILMQSAQVLQSITKSTGMSVYLVNEAKNEIQIVPRNIVNPRHNINWKIKGQSTLSAYVACSKEFVLCNDIAQDNRFPNGLGYLDDNIKPVLCMPILTPNGDCYATIELYKEWDQPPYTPRDLQYAVLTCGWMGAAINQSKERIALQRLQKLNDCLLDLIKCFFTSELELEIMITELMKIAKISIRSLKGLFYVIDAYSEELQADVYEESLDAKTFSMEKKNYKLKMAKFKGMAGLITRQGITVTLNNLQNDKLGAEVDDNGIITRCVMSTPIISEDKVIAVVQLVNKEEEAVNYFTKEDEKLFKVFSMYCSLALQYEKKRNVIRHLTAYNECYLEMLHKHMKPCVHDELFLDCPLDTEYPTGFVQFSWHIPSNLIYNIPLYSAMMIRDVFGTNNVNLTQLKLFVLMVKKAYRHKCYYNNEHAFNATHCIFNIIRRNVDIFTRFEMEAFIIAAICHDLDHTGFSNSFLEMTKNNLSSLYEESVWENHHFHVASIILNQCEFITSMDAETYKKFLSEIKNLILATDLVVYFRNRSNLLYLLSSHTFDWHDHHHQYLIKSIIMNASDLSIYTKSYVTAKTAVENLYQDYYKQAEAEKSMGLDPVPMMNKHKNSQIPEDQVQYLSLVVLPCMEILRLLLPNTSALYDKAIKLRESWQEIINMKCVKNWQKFDSIVPKFLQRSSFLLESAPPQT